MTGDVISYTALYRCRIAEGIERQDIADKAGMSYFSILRAETGQTDIGKMSVKNFFAILGALGPEYWRHPFSIIDNPEEIFPSAPIEMIEELI